jgi:hypothetical protein
MNVVILGSRIYQPLTDIDAALRELPPDATVTACGMAPVCARAVLAATARGLPTRHVTLSPDRHEVIELARRGAAVWLFQATDPATKQPAEGTAGIEALLRSRGIAPRLIVSPLPGRVCVALSRVQGAAERVVAANQEGRRRVAVRRALEDAQGLVALREEYAGRLEAGMEIGVGDDALDERWIGWERAYRACCDGLRDVGRVLATEVAA